MSKSLKGTLTLLLISALSGALLSIVNNLTYDKILQNIENKTVSIYREMYTNYDDYKITLENDEIKIVDLLDSNDSIIGTVYQVSGKNSYGDITILVVINDSDQIENLEFLTLNQTADYQSLIVNFANDTYKGDIDSLVVDTSTGATYGCTLVDELVNIAISYHKGDK